MLLAVHPLRLACLFLFTSVVLAGPETNMKLVWSDEFNGKDVDTKMWNPTGGVRIVDGQLSLDILPGAKPMFWKGSRIDTKGKYKSAYGFIEASILFVQTGGHGCSFGISNEDNKYPAAGMGFSNGGGDRVELSLWVTSEDRGRSLTPKDNPIPRDNTFSKKFHRFGFQWSASEYRWYVDGRLVNVIRVSANIPSTPKPMYIAFDHSRLPEAGMLKNFKDPNSGPEPLRIDWVKVYQ